MANFKQGDVIKVPFQYTDRATRQSRPALVISIGKLEKLHGLLWVAKIATIEASDASKIGSISPARLKRVKGLITAELGA